MCWFRGTMKLWRKIASLLFSTSLDGGIVVMSISIMCNILKITSQCFIQILALLVSYFDVVPRLTPSSSMFVNFPVKSSTMHGITVTLLSITPSNIDSADCGELQFPCLFCLTFVFFMWWQCKQKINEEFCVFSETSFWSSTKCTVMRECSKEFKAKEENNDGQCKLIAPISTP